jgi:phage tail sheath protein FI
MAFTRPPGVYALPKEQRYTPLSLVKSGVVGFVGLTQKGPTNTPVRLTEAAQFRHVFGRLPVETYLDTAVKGFFDNGGTECWVLRICHMSEKGRGEIARTASLPLRDEAGKLTIRVEALNEGTWGNDIAITVNRSAPRVETLLTLDMHEEDLLATVRSTHGFRRGTVIKIYDDDRTEYRTITEIDNRKKLLHWRMDEPIGTAFKSGAPTYVEPVEFELCAETLTEKEVFKELTIAPAADTYFQRAVNEQSRLIRLTDARRDAPISERFPIAFGPQKLSDGLDGITNVTPDDFIGMSIGPGERYGLAAFEANESVDLLAIPDLFWCVENSTGFSTTNDAYVVQEAMVEQAERMQNRFAILDLPNRGEYVQALQWRLLFDSAYAAFYYPWVLVEKDGEQTMAPPSGHVAGIFARCDEAQGVHRAPANEELNNVLDLSVLLQDSDIGYLNDQGVNCIRSFAKRGIRVWGARTTSSNGLNRYINVRRVILTIIRSMVNNLQWVVFEPNDARLWKTLQTDVAFFLMGLWRKGYFKGRSPEEAFYVKCDSEINTPELRDAGMVVVEVGVAPVRPAEFIVFRISEETAEVGPVPGE